MLDLLKMSPSKRYKICFSAFNVFANHFFLIRKVLNNGVMVNILYSVDCFYNILTHLLLYSAFSRCISSLTYFPVTISFTKFIFYDLKLSTFSAVADGHDTKSLVHSGMFYILEGVMPFIEVFSNLFLIARVFLIQLYFSALAMC